MRAHIRVHIEVGSNLPTGGCQALRKMTATTQPWIDSRSKASRGRLRLPPAAGTGAAREVEPGAEAHVDFGFAGEFLDPERGRVRCAWIFLITLSCSRHQYAELAFDQTVHARLRLHRAAFDFFGSIPRRLSTIFGPPSSTPPSTMVVPAHPERCSGPS